MESRPGAGVRRQLRRAPLAGCVMVQKMPAAVAYLRIADEHDRAVMAKALGELGMGTEDLADLPGSRRRGDAGRVVIIDEDERSLAAAAQRFTAIGGPVPLLRCLHSLDAIEIVRAVRLGVFSFVRCPPSPGELERAISFAHEQLDDLRHHFEALGAQQILGRLTRRQREIVDGLYGGLTNRQISEAFAISERTVEVHRARIIDKLSVRNTAGLIRLVALAGLPVLPERAAAGVTGQGTRDRAGSAEGRA